MWASSDHSPNITQGQDFGWRLAPEVVVEMKRIIADVTMLERIAARYNRPLEDVKETDVLMFISERTPEGGEPVATEADYSEEYQAEIRRIEREQRGEAGTITTTTTLDREALKAEVRRELEEEARKKAESVTTTTTTKRG